MAEKNDKSTDLAAESKRTPKYSGRKIPHSIHTFGEPGPYCTGTTGLPSDGAVSLDPNDKPEAKLSTGNPCSESVKKVTQSEDEKVAQSVDEDDEETQLLEKLKNLELAEAALEKQRWVKALQHRVAEAEQCLASLQTAPSPTPVAAAMMNSAANTKTKAPPETPLDGLLAGVQTNMAAQNNATEKLTVEHGSPDGPLSSPDAWQESLMYLKPAQLAKGERILPIVDLIDKIVPNIDERTISEVGLTKLMVSYGPKKPKLDSVSLAQWVIGNTRIFFTLLQLGKLPSPTDVQHYLAYTVKIMELSSKFTWASVLKYDDEFRHLQAIYNYPWSYDSPHLHTVLLVPISAPSRQLPSRLGPTTPSLGSLLANSTQEGKIICRNYNRSTGCNLYECHFAHVCNKKINGKACVLSRILFMHIGVTLGPPPPHLRVFSPPPRGLIDYLFPHP